MKTLLSQSVILLFTVLFIASCKAIIEPSIADRKVTAEAPGNGYQSASYNVSFWWDEVDDALKYRLQVVSPKFDSVSTLVLDTIIKANKFTLNLSPGNYQWRVHAENGSSKTEYSSPKSFVILYSSIKQQKVQLSAPANNALTSQSGLIFNWGSIYGATRYHIEVDTANFADETKVIFDKTIPGQQIALTMPNDHLYQWRVRAENDTAQSQWSSVNYFNYDHTPPAAVTLLLPADKQTVSSPVSLQWSSAATAVKYKVYVYLTDGKTLYSNSYPATTTSTSYAFSGGASGDTLYWKVTALDNAGNESVASELRSFTIQ